MSQSSFDPYFKHPVSEIYAISTLDFLIQIASALHFDLFWRSSRYANVSSETIEEVMAFRYKLGSHRDWPNIQQRSSIYRVLSLGNQLCSHAVGLRLAALDHSRASADVKGPFLQTLEDSVDSFREYARKNEGAAMNAGLSGIRAIFAASLKLLTNKEITQIFGIHAPPRAGKWPLSGDVSATGACLVSEMNDRLFRSKKGALPENLVMAKQRIAFYGARSIDGLLNKKSESARLELVKDCNSWSSALRDLVPHVVSLWRSPGRMEQLSEAERLQTPENPAGKIDLKGLTGPTADTGQTCTGGAYCCCDTVNYCDTDPEGCLVAEVTTIDTDEGHVDDYECDGGG